MFGPRSRVREYGPQHECRHPNQRGAAGPNAQGAARQNRARDQQLQTCECRSGGLYGINPAGAGSTKSRHPKHRLPKERRSELEGYVRQITPPDYRDARSSETRTLANTARDGTGVRALDFEPGRVTLLRSETGA